VAKPHEYHLLSIYAPRKEDEIVLLFEGGVIKIVENDFSARQQANEGVWCWVKRNKSVPGMLAQITLNLLESVTVT
jgi:hypothetical protein